eukprot:SAG11_NODE_654_length_7909_cov_7.701280_11_plen_34_part_00
MREFTAACVILTSQIFFFFGDRRYYGRSSTYVY